MPRGNKDIVELGRNTRFDGKTAAKNGRKGAYAKAKKDREKKTVSEILDRIMDTPVTDTKQLAMIQNAGLPVPEVPTYKDFFIATIAMRTINKGRMEDIGKLMEYLGETPMANDTEVLKVAREILEGVESAID